MTRKQRVGVDVQLWTGHHPTVGQAVLTTLAPEAPEPHTAHNLSFPGGQPGSISKAKLACYSRYLLTSYFCIPIPSDEKDIFFSC